MLGIFAQRVGGANHADSRDVGQESTRSPYTGRMRCRRQPMASIGRLDQPG